MNDNSEIFFLLISWINFGENGNAMFFNPNFFENENCGIGKNESFTNGEKTIRGKLKELEIYKFIEKN